MQRHCRTGFGPKTKAVRDVAKKRRRSGQLYRGPFVSADFRKALESDGWVRAKGGKHPNYTHPTRRGKAQVPNNWTAVKPGHDPWKNLCRQTGYTGKELLELLNRR